MAFRQRKALAPWMYVLRCCGVPGLTDIGFVGVWMRNTAGLLLNMHPKVVVEGVGIRAAEGPKVSKKSSKELKRLIQKSLATEEISSFHCWWQKWPLHSHKAISNHFFFCSSLNRLV
uniref:Uncharacterized protein n=1 Tax=Lepeophtheirus salmonis TaxID=72036 RepID=A0A0K2TLS6_LEPSM